MNYSQAMEYIHSVVWQGSRPGLERITELCRQIDDPQDSLRFIHVAGTNGKGSTCSMLASVLREAGYCVGMFTSPYVKQFNERMQVDGKPISNGELADIVGYISAFADKMEDKPTEFELITAVGFEFFRRRGCDVVVLEVGMGGRLDSTNIIKKPLVSVITGISLDHTQYLGNTVAEIAREKAGIIKRGVPVVFGGNNSSALSVIRDAADKMGAELTVCNRASVEVKSATLEGSVFSYRKKSGYKIGLLGSYQPYNAAMVIDVVSILNERGFAVPREALLSGLAAAKWHARFELLSLDPIIIYDGGHNIEGVTACRESIERYFPKEKVNILCGVMADKDYGEMIKIIAPTAARVFAVKPANPRALDAKTLAAAYREAGVPAEGYADMQSGIDAAVAASRGENLPLIVMGSLYMYEEFTDKLNEEFLLRKNSYEN